MKTEEIDRPVVSVVVTTKNEEGNIANCLKSIKSQTYPQEKIEIIVVDNNSIDRTKEIAKKFTNKIYNKGPQRSAQLNFGVGRAKGKYILFPDADMILSAGIIKECVEKCEKEGYIALYILERIVNLSSHQLSNLCNQAFNLCNQNFWIKVRDFERSFYNTTCIDAVRFVKRNKFLEIGGFDKDLDFGPDDWDFDRRIKATGKVDIIDTPLYHNEGEFNLRKYLKKKSHYSKSFDKYIQKWSHIDSSVSNGIKVKTDPIIKKQLGFRYRLFGVFMENKKWKKLLRYPLLTLGMYFLKSMIGIRYLFRRRI